MKPLSQAALLVLERLQRSPITSYELISNGLIHYPRNIEALRASGYRIQSEHMRNGATTYRLTGHKSDEPRQLTLK